MKRKAVIFGIKGNKLSKKEKFLLETEKPWGIILFSRNIKNLFQLKLLINSIKNIFKDKNYPILIDQEGGRVSRLRHCRWRVPVPGDRGDCASRRRSARVVAAAHGTRSERPADLD